MSKSTVKCGATFEFASGETTSKCRLPVDHDGDCQGSILGSNTSWPKGVHSEEQEYYEDQRRQRNTELGNKLGVSGDFMEASEHSYNCICQICKGWWVTMGPDENGGYGPFGKELTQ